MNNICFVICCKNTPQHQYIIKCVDSIKSHYPRSSIVIVDSNSEDKSYFDVLAKYSSIFIEDIKNTQYEYGAIVQAYNKYELFYDVFVFLQDSMELLAPIKELDTIKDGEAFVLTSNLSGWSSDLVAYDRFYDLHPDFDKIDILDKYPITIWNSFIINSNTLNLLIDNHHFRKIQQPNCKIDSRAMERAWTILFVLNNIKLNVISKSECIDKISGSRN
jgi:hypothetical protein